MADERAGAQTPRPDAASKDKIQSGGRSTNAAQPLNAADDHGGAERYPDPERRSFDPAADAPAPRQGAGDPSAEAEASPPGRHMGPEGDPVEGKP
jgi:hypothetical protein